MHKRHVLLLQACMKIYMKINHFLLLLNIFRMNFVIVSSSGVNFVEANWQK